MRRASHSGAMPSFFIAPAQAEGARRDLAQRLRLGQQGERLEVAARQRRALHDQVHARRAA